MNLIDGGAGCYIDGSHMSSFDFSAAVIEFAHDFGFELDHDQFFDDVQGIRNDTLPEDEIHDVMDAIDWTYEDALGYLNDNTREGLYWEVEDQSLYLVEDADASQ